MKASISSYVYYSIIEHEGKHCYMVVWNNDTRYLTIDEFEWFTKDFDSSGLKLVCLN